MTGLSEKTVTRSMAKLSGLIETSGIKTRGRPEKNAYFRFVGKGTESPIKKGLSVPQKGTSGVKKRDSQSSHLYNHCEPSIEEAAAAARSDGYEQSMIRAAIDKTLAAENVKSPVKYFRATLEGMATDAKAGKERYRRRTDADVMAESADFYANYPIRCARCQDTGNINETREGAKYDWDVVVVPCPECRKEKL